MHKSKILSYEHGNALFIILVAIALFSTLTVVVTRSSDNVSADAMDLAQARIHASSIMQFGHDVEQGVNRLLTIGGCDISEISFDYDTGSVTSYENTNSPADFSCHVFHENGARVIYREVEEDWLDGGSGTTQAPYGRNLFYVACIYGVGTDPETGNCNITSNTEKNGEIVLFVPFLKKEICEAITMKLMGTDTVPVETYNAFYLRPYQGSMSIVTAQVDYIGPDVKYTGYEAGCFTGDDAGGGANTMPSGRYASYHVLYKQ